MSDRVMVPVVPTEAMLYDGYDAFRNSPNASFAGRIPHIYAAMIAAAPPPPVSPLTVEGVARMIDPDAFNHSTVHRQHLARRREDAMTKAQAILAATGRAG